MGDVNGGLLACLKCGGKARVQVKERRLLVTCDVCRGEKDEPLVLFKYVARIAEAVEVDGVEVPPFVNKHYEKGEENETESVPVLRW